MEIKFITDSTRKIYSKTSVNFRVFILNNCILWRHDVLLSWVQVTGAQEWHIVSLVDNVTSPTTASHYVSMTSALRVWAQGSTARCTDSTRCTQTRVHSARGSTQFATEQVGRLRYVTAVDGGLEAFPLSIVICAPVVQVLFIAVSASNVWRWCSSLTATSLKQYNERQS